MLKHLKEQRQSEEGFTLIELMVVVLIMGILMAIAIPTFLATQGSAHDVGAKSNATNALTNEKAYYADNQVFSFFGQHPRQLAPLGDGPELRPAYTSSANTDLLIVAGSKSGNCYYTADSETGSTAYIGYAETTGASTCAAPTAWAGIAAVQASGTAGGATTLNSAGVPGKSTPAGRPRNIRPSP